MSAKCDMRLWPKIILSAKWRVIYTATCLLSMSKKFENFKSSSFVLTLHNYSKETIKAIKAIPCKAIIAGKEVGEKGETPHVQMAISFGKRQVRAKALMKSLKTHCVPQKMRGKWSDQSYCFKEGNLIRMEDNRKQGERNDIVEFRDAIKRGATDAQLLDQMPGSCAKFPRFITFSRKAFMEEKAQDLPRNNKKTHFYLWGESNAGKSTWVADNFPGFYEKSDTKWWDDYNGEEVVVIDDPRKANASFLFGFLKRWCNERKVRVEMKGASALIRFKTMVITANESPEDFFGDAYEDDAFTNRFNVIKFTREMRCWTIKQLQTAYS